MQLEKFACYAYDMYPEIEVLIVNLSVSVWENARQERSTELEDNHWHKSKWPAAEWKGNPN